MSRKSIYYTGFEHIFLVFSRTRWAALERELSGLSTTIASAPASEISAPLELKLRGAQGRRNSKSPAASSVNGDGGQAGGLVSESDQYQGEGRLAVVSRWFRHVAP